MRPIYRALQKLTPPQHTATSSPGIHTLVSVIASYEWSAIFGWISWQPIKQPLSALRFLKLIAYPSLWLWGVIRRQHFCNSWCENTEKKENWNFKRCSLCFCRSKEAFTKMNSHNNCFFATFSSWRSCCMTFDIFVTIRWQLYCHQTDCVLTIIGRLMMGRPRSQVEKMTCFLFTSHVSPEWPSCVSRWRAASM